MQGGVVTHTQPTPRCSERPRVHAGEAPEAKTPAGAGSPQGAPVLSGVCSIMCFIPRRVHLLHEAHVFFRVQSCGAPTAAGPAGRASSAPVGPVVFSGRFRLFPRLGCVSPVPGTAPDSWAGAEAGPGGQRSARPPQAPWPCPDPLHSAPRQVFSAQRGSPCARRSAAAWKTVPSALLSAPPSPAARAVLRPPVYFSFSLSPLIRRPGNTAGTVCSLCYSVTRNTSQQNADLEHAAVGARPALLTLAAGASTGRSPCRVPSALKGPSRLVGVGGAPAGQPQGPRGKRFPLASGRL